MFLTNEDYSAVCDAATLDVIQQSDETIRARAEAYAIEEISSYLRARYNMEAAFAATGNSRNNQLVMMTADVALYHLIAWLPKRMGFEIRETRYKRVIETLVDVHKKLVMNLPTYTDPVTGETDTTNPVKYGSMPKLRNSW
jgi:phage gp36-like protein